MTVPKLTLFNAKGFQFSRPVQQLRQDALFRAAGLALFTARFCLENARLAKLPSSEVNEALSEMDIAIRDYVEFAVLAGHNPLDFIAHCHAQTDPHHEAILALVRARLIAVAPANANAQVPA